MDRAFCQTPDELIAMTMASGDIRGLGLGHGRASAAPEDAGEGREVATAELARLEGVTRRFDAPGRGAVAVHFEEAEGGWLAHEMRVDASGRLTIKTKVSPFCRKNTTHVLW